MAGARERYHHGNLREALLLQARTLLAENGVDGVSLRQVASRAGVSRTAPYHHFKDKEALLAALVESGFQQLVADMQGHVRREGSVLDRFEAMGRAYVAFAMREPHLYRMMFGAGMQSAKAHPHVAEVADQAFGTCLGLVEEGIAAGEIGSDNAMLTALATWSTVHGVSMLLIEKRAGEGEDGCEVMSGPMSGIPVDILVDGVVDTLTHGLKAR